MIQPLTIEIAGKIVRIKSGDDVVKRTALADFIRECGKAGEVRVFEDPIPDGVRFVRARGSYTLAVMELKPQVRSVHWLADQSPTPYGEDAIYNQVRLSFPYVVLFILFSRMEFSGFAQCFFRTLPITCAKTDMLFLPNIRNCHDSEGLMCRLCLGHSGDIPEVGSLPWNLKISTIVEAFWTKGFNRSAESHQIPSYWSHKRTLDPRVGDIGSWEKATREDPLFPLKVEWAPAGFSVDQNIEAIFRRVGGPPKASQTSDFLNIINHCEPVEC